MHMRMVTCHIVGFAQPGLHTLQELALSSHSKLDWTIFDCVWVTHSHFKEISGIAGCELKPPRPPVREDRLRSTASDSRGFPGALLCHPNSIKHGWKAFVSTRNSTDAHTLPVQSTNFGSCCRRSSVRWRSLLRRPSTRNSASRAAPISTHPPTATPTINPMCALPPPVADAADAVVPAAAAPSHEQSLLDGDNMNPTPKTLNPKQKP